MLSFPRFRTKYKGPVNPISYFGMLGDIIVAVGLYALYQNNKKRKELSEPIKIAEQNKKNL
jgi:hypothetical protein